VTTLDLVLKHKWYDMIAMGKKREDCEFYHQNDPDYPDNCEYPDNPPCYYEP
jgi:hypothetical protein